MHYVHTCALYRCTNKIVSRGKDKVLFILGLQLINVKEYILK